MSDSDETASANSKKDSKLSSVDTTTTKPMQIKDSSKDQTSIAKSMKESHRQLQPPKVHMGLLTAACVIGVVATVIVLITMRQGVRNAWQKRDYQEADYLINGMYQPNI